MDVFVLRVFPVLLGAGALFLAWKEISAPALGHLTQGQRRMRLGRRLMGSVLLFGVAYQIWTGELPQGAQAQEQAVALVQHWVRVFGSVCLLVMLAVWDTWVGVRQLRAYLESVESDELGKIQPYLDRSPEGRALLDKVKPPEKI